MDVTGMVCSKLIRKIETFCFAIIHVVSIFSIHVPLQQSIFSQGNHFIHSNHLMDVTGMVCSKLIRKIETLCFAIIESIFSIHVPLQQSIFSKGNHFIHILITSWMSPGSYIENWYNKRETFLFCSDCVDFNIRVRLQQSMFSKGNHFIHIIITSWMSRGWHP